MEIDDVGEMVCDNVVGKDIAEKVLLSETESEGVGGDSVNDAESMTVAVCDSEVGTELVCTAPENVAAQVSAERDAAPDDGLMVRWDFV
jgi:hypothetical protein